MVAGQPVSVQLPASTSPGSSVRAPGRSARAPGSARNVAECSRVTKKTSTVASRAVGSSSASAGRYRARRSSALTAISVGSRQRDDQVLAPSQPRALGPVKDPLHRSVYAGRERHVEHAPVVAHMQVDDRRAAEPREHTRSTPACAGNSRAARSGGTARITTSVARVGEPFDLDAEPVLPWDDHRRAAPQAHVDPGRNECSLRRTVVDLTQRNPRDADVAGGAVRIRPSWKTWAAWASDASPTSRLSVGRAISPRPSRCFGALTMLAQPVTERAAICALVVGIDPFAGSASPGPQPGARGRSGSCSAAVNRRGAPAPEAGCGAARPRRPRAEDGDLQTWLQRDQRGGVQLREQVAVGRAAAQEYVLSVVGVNPVARERIRRAPEAAARLEQGHLRAGACAVERRGDPGKPAADDGHPPRAHRNAPIGVAAARLRAATHAFSHGGSEIRRRRTSPGSCVIRSRMAR